MEEKEKRKRCKYCARVKAFSEFGQSSREADGRRSQCRECREKQRKAVRQADYDALLIFQDHKCAICGVPEEVHGKRFSVDHNHDLSQDAVRGLLCGQCNTLIGMAEDDVQILQAAIGYLKHHSIKIIEE